MRSEPCIGERWRNKHTGETTRILLIAPVERERPTSLAQAPNGRLLFQGSEPYIATMVRFEGGSPPGYDDLRSGGWEVDTFLEHWERDENCEIVRGRAFIQGLTIIAKEEIATSQWWQWLKRRSWRKLGDVTQSLLDAEDSPTLEYDMSVQSNQGASS